MVRDFGLHDRLTHVVVVPVLGLEPVVLFTLVKEFGARVGDADSGLEGIDQSLFKERFSKVDGVLGVLIGFPWIADHAGDVRFESRCALRAGLLTHCPVHVLDHLKFGFDLSRIGALVEFFNGFLVDGFKTVKDKSEISFGHQFVLGSG